MSSVDANNAIYFFYCSDIFIVNIFLYNKLEFIKLNNTKQNICRVY